MAKEPQSQGTATRIPSVGPQIGKQQGISGVPVAVGQTWQDLTPEQRQQYFYNLQNRSKAQNTNSGGGSESY